MATELQIAAAVDPIFAENTFLVWRRDGGPCWIIDPGLPPSAERIIHVIREKELKPDAVVLTHGHSDHIAGVPEVIEAFPQIPVYMAEAAQPALTDPQENLSGSFGPALRIEVPTLRDLPAGGELTLDGTTWQVFDVSGHCPGSRALYCAEAGIVFVGDALFQGSIGRTDFHHSRHDELIRHIREGLFTLPNETRVFTGHGSVTTIGQEKEFNPFVGQHAG